MNLSPEQRFLTESLESALTLAKAGLGYTLYPQIPGIHEPGLCAIPVTTLPAVSFGVYCAASLDHPVLKTFLQAHGANLFFLALPPPAPQPAPLSS